MDYILDVHCHTVASGHAYSNLHNYVDSALEKGLKMVGISDHGPALPGSTNILYFQNLRVVPGEIKGLKVLKGVEANIIDYDGTLDIPQDNLTTLDYAIASLHTPCIHPSSVEDNTNAVLQAIKNPYIHIIGHPDDERYPLDYRKVVEAAKKYGVLLEVNNASLKPGGFRKNATEGVYNLLHLCRAHEVPVVLSSDAHIAFDVGDFSYCEEMIERVEFPKNLIVNTSVEKFLHFIERRKNHV